MQVCKISTIWLLLLMFTKTFRNFTLMGELPPVTNTKDGNGQLKLLLYRASIYTTDIRILNTNQNGSLFLRTGKKRSQKSQGDTICITTMIYCLVLLFLCPSCGSKTAKLVKMFTGCFSNAWSLPWAKRWHKLFALFPLKCSVQNTIWEKESGSKCVCQWRCILMGLLPAGRNWNKIQIALRWVGLKAKSAVSSLVIAFICAFGIYQAFS